MKVLSKEVRYALNVIEAELREKDQARHLLMAALVDFHEFVQLNLEPADERNHPVYDYLNWGDDRLAKLKEILR